MNTTRRIAIPSMLAVLISVATMIIKIPSPLKGYLNLGDCVVLLILIVQIFQSIGTYLAAKTDKRLKHK